MFNIGVVIIGGVGGVVVGWLDILVLYWINGIGCVIFVGLVGCCIFVDVCCRIEFGF